MENQKSFSIVIFLLFISIFSFSQVKDCSKFRTGKFFYTEVLEAYSIRDTVQQISYYPEGFVNAFKVKWLSDCEFELIFVRSTSADQQTYSPGDILTVYIDSIQGDCYIFTTTFKDIKYPQTQMCKEK